MLEEYKISNGNILIPSTKNSPEIFLDPKNGIFKITGPSYLENSVEFYYSLMRWLMEYSREPAKKTEVHLQFTYINSTSTITFMRILQLLESLVAANTAFQANWYYDEDDDEMKSLGEDFNSGLKVDMILIPVSVD